MNYYEKYLDFFFRKITGKIRWGYVILFVTFRCNARCNHCFYWQHLNKKDDLSLAEINEISKNLGTVQVLLLSGGEPFLRDDLFDIISVFVRNNNTKVISIPTNALLTNTIVTTVERLASAFPEITFSINPSVDEMHEKNDEMRGIKGAFDKAIATIHALEGLRLKHRNIELVVNTTISVFNYENIDGIIEFFKKFDLTYHNFELIRGNPKDNTVSLPPLNEIKRVHRQVIRARNFYIEKRKSGLLEKISVLGITKYTQRVKEEVLNSGELPFTCSAGKNIIVLEPNGEVRLCELLPPIGNLKKHNYDIHQLLRNEKTREIADKIKDCKCTHVCFINMSIANDTKSLLKIPYYFLKWKK